MVQLTEYQKYKIIFLHEEGDSIKVIANKMNINRNTVSKWINRYINSNMGRITGSGRPTICSNDVILAVQNEVNNNKYINLREIKKNLADINIVLSTYTIKKVLNEHGYMYQRHTKVFPLSEEHKSKRLKFAITYLNFNWSDVIFSDEVSFWINIPPKRWCNKHITEDHDVTFKHPSKINAWGSICVGKSFNLNLFTEIMNAKKYVEILNKSFIGKYTENLFFLFDNDPKHKSIKANNFIKKNKIKKIDFPPNSPDLNPIENIWALLKKRLAKYHYVSMESFKVAIENEWHNICTDTIKNSILSMNERLQLIIDNRGEYINY